MRVKAVPDRGDSTKAGSRHQTRPGMQWDVTRPDLALHDERRARSEPAAPLLCAAGDQPRRLPVRGAVSAVAALPRYLRRVLVPSRQTA